jgi:predicted double-glycine peptidase
MHIVELLLMIAVCGGAAVGAFFAVRRRPGLRYPLLGAGLLLLTFNLISRLMAERFYFLFPESLLTEVLYAGCFVIIGVLSARYLDTSFRRIIFLVFLVVLSFFTLADHAYFAVAGGRLRALQGEVVRGVTLQSTGFSCVPASLATVLRRWGIECSEGEIAYALRTSFRGTSIPRVPGVVAKLGAARKLQAKVIKTTWYDLLLLDVPCLLSTRTSSIEHCSALIGLDGTHVIAGEPLSGIVRLEWEKYMQEWRWNGRAVIIARDFLHSFSPSDSGPRCDKLFEVLGTFGYGNRDKEGVMKFQRDRGLLPTGRLDWRTILVIDSLTGPPSRPRLSRLAELFKEQPGE